MDGSRENLSELARVLERHSRRLSIVVPVIDDQAMRCECREAAAAAVELMFEIKSLLNQQEISPVASRSVGTRSMRTIEGIYQLASELLPVMTEKAELMKKQEFLNRCWEVNG